MPPLFWVSSSFITGIIAGSLLSLPATFWLTLTVVTLVLVFIFTRISRFSDIKFPLLLIACTVALFLGAGRYQFDQPDITLKHIAFYNDRTYDLLVTGMVSDLPDYRDTYTNLRLDVQAVDTGDGDFPVTGLILARVPPNREYHYGQTLRLRGKLQTPPEDEEFSYRDYLAGKNIYSYMSISEATLLPEEGGFFILKAIYALKETSLDNIYRIFPDPEASLLAGILLGVDSGLPKDIQRAFKNTGTSHIIAISGFNIAIISGIFITLFRRRFGERRGAAAAVVMVLLYAFLVGADASVLRAAIMGIIGLLAYQIGRRQKGVNTLLIVAAIMCFWNPLYVWDAGFQLSFFATLGLILYSESFSIFSLRIIGCLTSPDNAQKINAPFSNFVLLTLAAQLTTLPIMAYHFNQIPLVSIIANPFILPVQPVLMNLAGLALLLSYVWIPLGQLAAWTAWPFAVYTIRAVEFFNWPSWIRHLGDSPIWFTVFFYTVLFSMTLGLPKLRDILASLRTRVQNISSISMLAALAVVTFLVWRAAFSASDGKLHITFLDVGSADAVLIQTPSGRHVLVNGGPSASLLSNELGRRLPFSRKLDWLVIASTDEDQMAALPRVLDRYPPKNVLWSGSAQASFSAGQVEIWLSDKSIPVMYAETGQKLNLGDGAFIEVQAAGPRGSVLLIQWNNFRALLPIGIDMDNLGTRSDPVDVLLLADSGSAASNPKEWIVGLNPQLIVLSVGAGDKKGLPSPDTLDAAGGYSLLRTDRNGWVTVTTDGNEMQVEVKRKEAVIATPTP